MCEFLSMEVGYYDFVVLNNVFDWSVLGLSFEFMNIFFLVIYWVVFKIGLF